MLSTRLVRWRIFDIIVFESLEENYDFSDILFELTDAVIHCRNLVVRLAERINDRILKRHSRIATAEHMSIS